MGPVGDFLESEITGSNRSDRGEFKGTLLVPKPQEIRPC